MANKKAKAELGESEANSSVQRELVKLTQTAYLAAPDYLKYFIFGSGIVGLLVLAAGVYFGSKDHAPEALIALLAAMAFFIINGLILFFVFKRVVPLPASPPSSPSLAEEEVGSRLRIVWSRLAPKLPLDERTQGEITRELEDIRNKAFTWLQDNCPADQRPKKSEQIRANVFFPGREPPPGDSCMLAIPVGLSLGMDKHPDCDITFRPEQGLAGIVFVQQEKKWAVTLQDTSGQHHFDSIHNLTEEQQRKLHPELRWIVSFPLLVRDGDDKKAAGVLGVDGLGHQPDGEKLNDLLGALLPRVERLADRLGKLPMSRVLVGFREDA